jgi:hypothetical protein
MNDCVEFLRKTQAERNKTGKAVNLKYEPILKALIENGADGCRCRPTDTARMPKSIGAPALARRIAPRQPLACCADKPD